jgi:hypothetical protein
MKMGLQTCTEAGAPGYRLGGAFGFEITANGSGKVGACKFQQYVTTERSWTSSDNQTHSDNVPRAADGPKSGCGVGVDLYSGWIYYSFDNPAWCADHIAMYRIDDFEFIVTNSDGSVTCRKQWRCVWNYVRYGNDSYGEVHCQ